MHIKHENGGRKLLLYIFLYMCFLYTANLSFWFIFYRLI